MDRFDDRSRSVRPASVDASTPVDIRAAHFGDRHDAEDLVQRAFACGRSNARISFSRTPRRLAGCFRSCTTWINELRARSVRSRSGMDWDDEFLETVADLAARTPEQHAMDGCDCRSRAGRLPDAQRVACCW